MGKHSLRSKVKLHPLAGFFHLAFKVAALVVYLLSGWFTQSFMVPALAILLLLSLDFWIVKNITGRLLVGLRWQCYVDENGKNRWIYEQDEKNLELIDRGEEKLFWFSLVICTSLWFIITFLTIFGTFKWFIITGIAFILNLANLYGYLCCKFDVKDQLAELVEKHLRKSKVNRPAKANNEYVQTMNSSLAHLTLNYDIELTSAKSLQQQENMEFVAGAENKHEGQNKDIENNPRTQDIITRGI